MVFLSEFSSGMNSWDLVAMEIAMENGSFSEMICPKNGEFFIAMFTGGYFLPA